MQAEHTSFWDWQQHFSDEKTCLQSIINLKRPEVFSCQHCGHKKAGYFGRVMSMNVQIVTIIHR